MIIPHWALLAFSASILWGLGYAISGKLMHSGLTPAFLIACSSILTLPFYIFILLKSGALQSNLDFLSEHKGYIALLALQAGAVITGVFLIYGAIQQKNATYASIIEISYPMFVCFFSWLLFRDIQINWNIALGALLIFCGSALVLIKS